MSENIHYSRKIVKCLYLTFKSHDIYVMISPVFPRSHVSELCDNEMCFMCTTLNTGANYIAKAAKYKISEGCYVCHSHTAGKVIHEPPCG